MVRVWEFQRHPGQARHGGGARIQPPHFLGRGAWAWKASAEWVGLGVSRLTGGLGKGAAWEALLWMDFLSWTLPSPLAVLNLGSSGGEGSPRSLFFSILPLPHAGHCEQSPSPLGEHQGDVPAGAGTEM